MYCFHLPPHLCLHTHAQNKALALVLLAGPVFAVAPGLALVLIASRARCRGLSEYLGEALRIGVGSGQGKGKEGRVIVVELCVLFEKYI